MNENEIFATSTGLWKRKSNGTVVVWFYGDKAKRLQLASALAQIWFQVDGVKTASQIAESVMNMAPAGTGMSKSDVLGCLENLRQIGLIYRIGHVWVDKQSTVVF